MPNNIHQKIYNREQWAKAQPPSLEVHVELYVSQAVRERDIPAILHMVGSDELENVKTHMKANMVHTFLGLIQDTEKMKEFFGNNFERMWNEWMEALRNGR